MTVAGSFMPPSDGVVMLSVMLTPNLVSWQWRSYPLAHTDRRNLVLHALTMPLFALGLAVLVFASLRLDVRMAIFGMIALLGATAAQGRGHRFESERPAPFRSPLDFIARFFVEQLVSFPRFVLSGRFRLAWREAANR